MFSQYVNGILGAFAVGLLGTTSPHAHSSISTRPVVGTVADIEQMVTACRGTRDGMESVRDVAGCLSYLDDNQHSYFIHPTSENPHDRYQESFIGQNSLNDAQESVLDGCPGEIFDYHGYWSGNFTWRVELFMKGYLFTQNIRCSRLTMWIDETADPGALQRFLTSDRFQQFEPLRQLDLIRLKAWTLPDRVFLPAGIDHSDGYGFVDNMERRGKYPDSEVIADAVQRDPEGREFLRLNIWGAQEGHSITSMSDVFRFLILHVHGGLYLDVDMLLLRDMRPLLMTKRNFAERWGALSGFGDYNTGVMALQANSSLSAFCMRAGTRQGMYFHPRAIGRYLWRDGRADELLMLESATFDPVWPSFAQMREGACPSPCFNNFKQFFETSSGPASSSIGEWATSKLWPGEVDGRLKHFFSGAFTYHIHNQWKTLPEHGSWLQLIMAGHDDFLAGSRPNLYGEWWDSSLGTSLKYRNIS